MKSPRSPDPVGWSLAFFRTASTTEFEAPLRVDPSRFWRDDKEAGGVCRRCGESTEMEFELADN
jgi:hypothetical protein